MSEQIDPEFEKLRRLLAVKRHERPPANYFENFLDEFHRRQRTEPLRKPGWWEQLTELFRAEPLLAARYALGSAIVLMLCLNVYLLVRTPPTGRTELATIPPVTNGMIAVAKTGPGFQPMPPPGAFAEPRPQPVLVASNNFILDRVNAAPVNYDPTGDF